MDGVNGVRCVGGNDAFDDVEVGVAVADVEDDGLGRGKRAKGRARILNE